MCRTVWIAILIILSFSNFLYAQESDRKSVPSQLMLSPMESIPLDSAADHNQVLPELKKQAYVGTQQFKPQLDNEWVEQCLNLSLDQKKWGCKIIAYRIQWFNGQWSTWFVPGINDLYKKSFEPMRRYWACFNDHSFEIIYMADQKKDFSKIKIEAVTHE